jgi:hypothetical protein
MATFRAVVTYSFDTEYEFEADTQDEAEDMAENLSTEWLPYSSEKGYTDFWNSREVDVYHESGEIDEED